ncbi:MAG: cryptochrome/photolyase family protein, partial [Acidobacteriaceae bacterium]|nr:cryptochrome/photolyase family protein [Acidobacteriaceae bacterium]
MPPVRNLVIVLGDQLNAQSSAFDNFDPVRDVVWMAEVKNESTYVLSHKVRIAYFLSAMRHFAQDLRAKKYRLEYRRLDENDNEGELESELRAALAKFEPQGIIALEPGEYRIEAMLKAVSNETGIPIDIRLDRDFYCSREEFRAWAENHPHLRMEFFYHEMRKRSGVLMEDGRPKGGKWNFDPENRKSFGKSGPGLL